MVIAPPSDMEVASEKSLTRKDDFVARAEIGALVDRYRGLLQRYTEDRNNDIRELYTCKNVVIGIVGPKEGGLSFSDESVSVKIPEGALSKPILMHCYRDVGQAVNGENTNLSGHRLIQYSPRLNFGPDGTIFQKPITVRLRHSISKKDWRNGYTKKLKVHHADNDEWSWKLSDTEQCRLDGEWMEITLDHFGIKPESESCGQQETSVAPKTNQEKKMPVTFEGARKLLSVDMGNLEVMKEIIQKRFAIEGDFEVLGTLPDSEDPFNIHDDDDLHDCKDAVALLVNRKRKPTATTPGNDQTDRGGDRQGARSVQPQPTFLTQVPVKEGEAKILPVVFEGRRKSVSVDLDCLRSTRCAIRQKFKIDDTFQLKAKTGTGEYFDIDDEDDIDDLKRADALLIEMASGDGAGCQQLVPSNSQQLVPAGKDTKEGCQELYLDPENEVNSVIKYKGATYNLYQPPAQESIVVAEAGEDLKKTMNIPSIVEKMELTADFLRLAYLGVLGNRELHKIIQDMQFDIAKLSKLCDTTIVQFMIKAGDVIDDLECGFGYLLEGHDECALENFSSIGETSKLVLETTMKLKKEFEEKEKAIEKILTLVTKEYRSSSKVAYSAETERMLKQRIESGESETAKSREKCEQLKANISDSKAKIGKEAAAKKPVRDDFFKWVKQGYLYTDELGAVVSDKEKMLSNMAKEERLQELEEHKQAKAAELRANRELMEMLETMKKIDTVNDADGMVKMALRGAETGVKSLRAALKPVIDFWEKLAMQCDSIAATGTESRLKQACDPEKGKAFWASSGFKRQALKFYARWVALRKMCDNFHEGMARVEEGIQLCIRDNPSAEKAKERMVVLMDELDRKNAEQEAKLKKQRAIADAEQSQLQKSVDEDEDA